jgi:hypothetical protein
MEITARHDHRWRWEWYCPRPFAAYSAGTAKSAVALREDGAVPYSASLLGIVSPSFYHPLFSGLEYPHRILGVDPFEGASYIGIIASALWVIAL